MKNKIYLILILILTTLPCLVAQETEKPIITVLDFKTSGISDAEAEIFVDFLSSHIISSGVYRVIDRMQREAMLDEMDFSYTGYSDENNQLQIGKMLAANKIIVGSIGQVGDRYLLTIKLIDVETGEVVKSGSEKYRTLNDLIDDSKRLAETFAGAETAAEAALVKQEKEKETEEEVSEKTERKGGSLGVRLALLNVKEINSSQTESIGAAGIAGHYIYQFNNTFSLGAWLGAGTGIIYPEDVDYNVVVPVFGVILLFGNKVDGFAVAANLGIPIGVGLYYKNFSVGIARMKLFDELSISGIEFGYSYFFNQN